MESNHWKTLLDGVTAHGLTYQDCPTTIQLIMADNPQHFVNAGIDLEMVQEYLRERKKVYVRKVTQKKDKVPPKKAPRHTNRKKKGGACQSCKRSKKKCTHLTSDDTDSEAEAEEEKKEEEKAQAPPQNCYMTQITRDPQHPLVNVPTQPDTEWDRKVCEFLRSQGINRELADEKVDSDADNIAEDVKVTREYFDETMKMFLTVVSHPSLRTAVQCQTEQLQARIQQLEQQLFNEKRHAVAMVRFARDQLDHERKLYAEQLVKLNEAVDANQRLLAVRTDYDRLQREHIDLLETVRNLESTIRILRTRIDAQSAEANNQGIQQLQEQLTVALGKHEAAANMFTALEDVIKKRTDDRQYLSIINEARDIADKYPAGPNLQFVRRQEAREAEDIDMGDALAHDDLYIRDQQEHDNRIIQQQQERLRVWRQQRQLQQQAPQQEEEKKQEEEMIIEDDNVRLDLPDDEELFERYCREMQSKGDAREIELIREIVQQKGFSPEDIDTAARLLARVHDQRPNHDTAEQRELYNRFQYVPYGDTLRLIEPPLMEQQRILEEEKKDGLEPAEGMAFALQAVFMNVTGWGIVQDVSTHVSSSIQRTMSLREQGIERLRDIIFIDMELQGRQRHYFKCWFNQFVACLTVEGTPVLPIPEYMREVVRSLVTRLLHHPGIWAVVNRKRFAFRGCDILDTDSNHSYLADGEEQDQENSDEERYNDEIEYARGEGNERELQMLKEMCEQQGRSHADIQRAKRLLFTVHQCLDQRRNNYQFDRTALVNSMITLKEEFGFDVVEDTLIYATPPMIQEQVDVNAEGWEADFDERLQHESGFQLQAFFLLDLEGWGHPIRNVDVIRLGNVPEEERGTELIRSFVFHFSTARTRLENNFLHCWFNHIVQCLTVSGYEQMAMPDYMRSFMTRLITHMVRSGRWEMIDNNTRMRYIPPRDGL